MISYSGPVEEALDQYYERHDEQNVDTQLIVTLLRHVVQLNTDTNPNSNSNPNKSRNRRKGQGPGSGSGLGPGSGLGLGAVLVFLAGWQDILDVKAAVEADPVLGNPNRVLCLSLHSSVPTSKQKLIFQRPPPGVDYFRMVFKK